MSSSVNIENEIRPLTFFRFITAFMVFVFHVKIHGNINFSFNLFDIFVSRGAIFMTAFFILSGFVLYYVYHNKNLLDKNNLKKYYLKRFFKIYPPYLVIVIISWIFYHSSTIGSNLALLPMQVFCLQSLFYSTFGCLVNGGTWSLSVEMLFYFLFPFFKFLFELVKKYRIRSFICLYLLSIYPSIIQCFFGGTDDLYVNPIFRIPEFLIGVCVANEYFRYRNKDKPKNHTGASAIFGFVVLVMGIAILDKNNFFNHIRFEKHYNYYNVFIIPILSFIIYRMSVMTNKIILLLTNNVVSNYLGKISYSFYLTQFIAVGLIGKKYLLHMDKPILLITLFTLNVIFSILLYEFVEKKARKLIVEKYT